MIFIYFLQYSNYFSNIFHNFKYEVHFSIDREIELIPYAVTGFNLNAFKVIYILKKYEFQTFIFSFITFILVDNFDIFSNVNKFYQWGGIKVNILSVNLIFIFSTMIPSRIYKIKYIASFIEYITRYTAGIYYLHMPIYSYLKKYILCIKKGTIEGVFMIYIISYSICCIGMLFFGKTKAKNLFS